MEVDEGTIVLGTNSSVGLTEEALLGHDQDETMDKPELSKITGRERSNSSLSAETERIIDGLDERGLKIEDNDDDGNTAKNETHVQIEPETETVVGSVPLVEAEEQDDIIVLDDEEEDEQSGVSDSKKARKENEDEIMEIDDNDVVTKEEKETVGKVVRKMSRQDLEDLVLAKIVEAVVAHTEVGKLRTKVLELQLQKDKMASKMGTMMKQVAELSSAVNVIMDNEARDPKNRITKPHVIRFNRSVGLQTSIEPSVRSAPPKIIRVPEPIQNGGIKQYGGSVGKTPVYAGSNGTFNPPQSHGVKRVYQASKTGDIRHNMSQSSSTMPSPRKVYSPAASAPPRMHPIAPKPVSVPHAPVSTPTPQSFQPGIVDLTDDDPPASSSGVQNVAASVVASSAGPATTIINGVQYQIVNRSPTASGVQIVPAPGGPAAKYIVASGQNRPVVLQQLGVGGASQQQMANNQQIMLRGATAPVTIIQRPVVPRTIASNGNMGSAPRVAATIAANARSGNSVLGAASNMPRRFVLPPLPATPISKVKNDTYRPPPKPELTLNEQADGIVLSWNLPTVNNMAEVTTYQIFACQEPLTNNTSRPSQWKRVGDVKALPLPMACTLSQFTEENRYYFIVRGIDVYGRVGPFCDPQNILLRRKK